MSRAQDHDVGRSTPRAMPPPLPRRLALADALPLLEQAISRVGGLRARLERAPFRNNLTRAESRLDAMAPGPFDESDLLRLLVLEASGERPAPKEMRVPTNVAEAADHGLAQARRNGRAGLTLSLLTDLHRMLCASVALPGEPGTFRRSVSGAAAFTEALQDLGRFLTDPPPLPLAVRCGLVVAQIEMLVPFDHFSRRIAWLMPALIAAGEGAPLLFMAKTLSSRRESYEAAILSLQQSGQWEPWLGFFLSCLCTAADSAAERVGGMERLQLRWDSQLAALRSDSTARRLAELALGVPVLTAGGAQDMLGVSFQTANAAVATLVRLGILAQHANMRRNRVFFVPDALSLLAGSSLDPERISRSA